MYGLVDEHRDVHGVEPICKVLPIAPSTYDERVAQRRDPSLLSVSVQRDQMLKPEMVLVFAETLQCAAFARYGCQTLPMSQHA